MKKVDSMPQHQDKVDPGFAEKAQIKGADQLETISLPIDPIHIHGEHVSDKRPLHSDTKMPSAHKMPDYANEEKLSIPKVKTGLKSPKI